MVAAAARLALPVRAAQAVLAKHTAVAAVAVTMAQPVAKEEAAKAGLGARALTEVAQAAREARQQQASQAAPAPNTRLQRAALKLDRVEAVEAPTTCNRPAHQQVERAAYMAAVGGAHLLGVAPIRGAMALKASSSSHTPPARELRQAPHRGQVMR
jgi:hypothetical protein